MMCYVSWEEHDENEPGMCRGRGNSQCQDPKGPFRLSSRNMAQYEWAICVSVGRNGQRTALQQASVTTVFAFGLLRWPLSWVIRCQIWTPGATSSETVVCTVNKIDLATAVKGKAKRSVDSSKWENIFFSPSKAIKHMPTQITLREIIYDEKGERLHTTADTGKLSKTTIFWKILPNDRCLLRIYYEKSPLMSNSKKYENPHLSWRKGKWRYYMARTTSGS